MRTAPASDAITSTAPDSNGYWRYTPMPEVISSGHTRLHLLTHPGWWTPEPMSPSARVHRCIRGRAQAVRRAYDHLLSRAGRLNLGETVESSTGDVMNTFSVILTEIRPSDAEPLFRWVNEPALVRMHGPYRPVSWSSHQRWTETLDENSTNVFFAIRLEQDGPAIGLISLRNIHPVHRSAELFVRIGAHDLRGKGYGTTAIRQAIDFAFGDLNLERVYLHVLADNAAAVRVYEKAGLMVEGRLRRGAYINGKWHDVLLMARLRDIEF